MISLIPILFAAGVLTILLPCILPLVPIVLGTSIAGRSKLRPLFVIVGMLISFVIFTFILTVVLAQFPRAADLIRIATYYVLLLFGAGFLFHDRKLLFSTALAGSFFFLPDVLTVAVAAALGCSAMHVGGVIASKLQNIGSNIQQSTQQSLGVDNPIGGLVMGLTLGLVWVPCAGPALSFVFTLLRERPGLEALILLLAYGLGTAIPLLLIGYGGQYAVHSVRALSKYSGHIKKIAGGLLIASALALQFHWFRSLESWLVQNTSYGTLGTRIEERWFGERVEKIRQQ